MSAKALYREFGVRGYEYVGVQSVGGQAVIEIRHGSGTLRCSVCGSANVIKSGTSERIFRHLPHGNKPVNLLLEVQRLDCRACDAVRQQRLGFADPRVSYTKAFERFVVDLSKLMSLWDVANHLRVGWDVVKGIVARSLLRRYRKPKLRHLRQIAIDEISIGHGHRYLTVVLDLKSGAVVFVGEGKGVEALEPFWRRLRASHARVRAVAIDMSKAYIKAVTKNLPRAAIVFDRFHIVKLFNDRLSALRREIQRAASETHKKVLKGTRWLLVKNPENLLDRRNERQRLDEALAINKPLATAYYLKEKLRLFWECGSRSEARRFLIDWCSEAICSGVNMLFAFADTIYEHFDGILAWYDYPISTGPLEGMNNKIKTLQRQAYGLRDREFFKLRIYAIHEAKWQLVG